VGFLAHCPKCGKRVTVESVLGGTKLDHVLEENDGCVEVVCFLREHRWKLNDQDKTHLRNLRSRAIGRQPSSP
jgi:hypothetical protein